jgi:integrase
LSQLPLCSPYNQPPLPAGRPPYHPPAGESGRRRTRIGNHTFRSTGITADLKNSGKLEAAQQIANHESPRTTKLYDRRNDEISLDEIERIAI